ncbi:class 1 fructose-bisphosphatase [Thalassotalea aquiviva]|uniref:class 1 fructose-bisphosphatase n=1 Tax=Thalassotalea aquiviva TaxID=3242415 RepID=UPI00352AF2BD
MKRLVQSLKDDNAPSDLINLINTILVATKELSFRVGQGFLSGYHGTTLDENIQGEIQQKLDVVANQLLKDIILESEDVKAISSEEEDEIVAGNENGKYLVSFDPLDGSSNIEINSLVGTIFSILPAPKDNKADDASMFLQPGINQLCAGYVLYGPSTTLVMTTGKGTHFYTLDRSHGSYMLTHKNVELAVDTSEFAINMSNRRYWLEPMRHYIDDLVLGVDGPRERDFNMRWIAALVAEVHRVLNRSGIFTYPLDTKKPGVGRLRLGYEANPMSFIIEQAGGLSMTSEGRIMEMTPTDIHQRVEMILGSKNEVEKCLSYFKDFNPQ